MDGEWLLIVFNPVFQLPYLVQCLSVRPGVLSSLSWDTYFLKKVVSLFSFKCSRS